MMQSFMQKKVFFLLMVSTLAGMMAFIANTYAKDDISLIANDRELQKELAIVKLNDIIRDIKQQRKEVDANLQLLMKAKTEQEKNRIQNELNELNNAIVEQESSFEMILTAGLELEKDDTEEQKNFNWQKDLLEIVQPILSELRQLTENKRKLDNLNKKIVFYTSQIANIEEALKHISKINTQSFEKEALIEFERIDRKWRDRLAKNRHLLEIVQLQYDEMIKSQSAKEVSVGEHIEQFATGRGTTLLMALIAFIAVYFSMISLLKLLHWLSNRKKEQRRTYYQRVSALFYHFLMAALAVAAAFYVLSVRNDQVLIGITVLLLLSIILLLKSSIPSYVNELRILLNTGSVREGECIIYNGIPMQVESLNYYTKLVNPLLPGLELRLTLAELANYVSRPYLTDEPWFPCQVGDYVMLSDGSYGMVKCITLENILLSLSDGTMPRTYTIPGFLAASPKNFSQGFIVVSDFGVDYKHQMICTTEIPDKMAIGIREGLMQEAYGGALQGLSVYFSEANTSSLDYKIVATFEGMAAKEYFAIRRALQRYAVEVCNHQQWIIPFTQVVVHNEVN
ncbi:hypothetical protein [Nitrosomonas sp.]|uniref:hypothetical protein n=1 Tax=Nitrosomonas sp. TaxID=42353 RepID=UPI001D6BFC28|nr:hypothetical protein [Nitrosomonas sp.]MBX3616233.1 hypothetical protein [Nitrosomonas sp.]